MATQESAFDPSGHAAVLLVDDSPANLLALEAVLSPLGVRTVSARSGQEALEHARHEPFAVALVDVQMPDMDGFELTARLRQSEFGRDLPIVLITAIHRDEGYVHQGYERGAADYITKPFDIEVVRARVKSYVRLFEQREAVRREQVALRTRERDEATRRLVAFERIASAALESKDLGKLLDELLRAFIDAAEAAEFAAVWLREGQALRAQASVGLESAGAPHDLQVGHGFVGTIAAERRPLELADASSSPLLGDQRLRAIRPRGLYGVPLLWNGDVLGVAIIGSTRAGVFSDGEKRLFGAAAERSALAVARQLELSELHQVLRAAPAAIAIVQAWDSTYTFVNPTYEELFGPELIGAALAARGPGQRVVEAVECARASGETVKADELVVFADRLRESSPKSRYLNFTAQPLCGPNGSIDRVLLFAVDATAQVLARKEIEAAQIARAELLEKERAARLAAELASSTKDQFLATVTHELRTPLQAIVGWIALARAKTPLQPERVFEVVERNAHALSRIVEDIIDSARFYSGRMRLVMSDVDLGEVVNRAVEAVRPAAAAKRIDIDLDLELGEPLFGDGERLQQVVWNLLTNAIKFTPEGGRVEVSGRCAPGVKTVCVRDSGIGIDSDFIPHVFEPFRQAQAASSRRHGGLGLGLSIVKQIALAHGGTIRAESDGPGRGSTFTLDLPARAKSGEAARASGGKSGRPLEGLRVLVVDDDPDARALIGELIETQGARVFAAGTAEEAIVELERRLPDVLVSDLYMPGLDGYALVRLLRALRPEHGGLTPALALTADARAETRARALAEGFQRYAAKPVNVDQLTVMLKELGTLAARGTERTGS
jgi:signal transduction histidine kinase/DNA-binding response OmpR family regulator